MLERPAHPAVHLPDGNLGLLLRSSGATAGPRTGGAFSLKALSAAVQPVPIWWKSSTQHTTIYQVISQRSAGFGVAVLVLLAVAAVMAVFPLRCRPLAALAVVTLVTSLGSLVTYSGIPLLHGSLSTLGYLILVLFPIGVLSWLVVGSWAVLTGRLVLRRLATTRLAGRAVPGAGLLAGLAATALLTVGAILALSLQGHTVRRITSDPAMAATSAASRQIVRRRRASPLPCGSTISIRPSWDA